MTLHQDRSRTTGDLGKTRADLGDWRGPTLAAMLAAVAALPGLWLPFLSDDWAHLAAVAEGPALRTPFGYYRPLCMIIYWLDRLVWGLSPSLFHLTNLVLIGSAAALVVVLVRRYTGDPALAGAAGILFGLHPYHIESAAWIAALADPLFSLLFLSAALAYDRWRARTRALPITALLLFEASLLAKETAVTLPVFLVFLGLGDKRRRPQAAEWGRGLLPMAAVALVHFVVLRPWGLGEPGLSFLGQFRVQWVKNLALFGAAAILPAHTEVIEAHPKLWVSLAALAAAALTLVVLTARRRIPAVAWAAMPAFAILVGPSVISFQERYLFLPSAASALGLAALLNTAGRRARAVAAGLLVAGWIVSAGDHWIGWCDGGRASRRLIADLVEASAHPGVQEIVVANMPHRVHGAPVAADYGAAVAVSGGRPVAVRTGIAIDYPVPEADALDGSFSSAVSRPPPFAEIRLRIPDQRYSRYVWPLPVPESKRIEREWAVILLDNTGGIRVRIPPAPGGTRSAYVWSRGRLEPVF